MGRICLGGGGEMEIFRGPSPTNNFLKVSNVIVRDSRLSYRARGILFRLLSNAPGFRMSAETLAREGQEGRDSIRKALQELRATGYLLTKKIQDQQGRWKTINILYDSPQPENPTPENQASEYQKPGNRIPVDESLNKEDSGEKAKEESEEEPVPLKKSETPQPQEETGESQVVVFFDQLPDDLPQLSRELLAHLPVKTQGDIVDELVGRIRAGEAKSPEGLLRYLARLAQDGKNVTQDFARKERKRRASIKEQGTVEQRAKKARDAVKSQISSKTVDSGIELLKKFGATSLSEQARKNMH